MAYNPSRQLKQKYDLILKIKTDKSTTLSKIISDKQEVEIFNSHGVISIDLINGEDRMVIASRYECRNDNDLTFLLTRGRVKSIFTPC